jgi:hypothetical protein
MSLHSSLRNNLISSFAINSHATIISGNLTVNCDMETFLSFLNIRTGLMIRTDVFVNLLDVESRKFSGVQIWKVAKKACGKLQRRITCVSKRCS